MDVIGCVFVVHVCCCVYSISISRKVVCISLFLQLNSQFLCFAKVLSVRFWYYSNNNYNIGIYFIVNTDPLNIYLIHLFHIIFSLYSRIRVDIHLIFDYSSSSCYTFFSTEFGYRDIEFDLTIRITLLCYCFCLIFFVHI